MQSIYNYTEEMWKEYLINMGEKPFRASQMMEWFYRHRIHAFQEMSNISKKFIAHLEENFIIDSLKCVTRQISSDGTQKFLCELSDGNLIETVLMNHNYGYSVCVTSEVGCNMGCVFCASGMKKKLRNLTTAEMVLQVLMVSTLAEIRVSHVVVMGIGEPFDNYDNVINFLKIINHAKGLEIGARHITVSTCGLVPKIREYASFDLQVNLAISLHAPKNEIRDQIMPINKRYPLEELMDAVKYYISITAPNAIGVIAKIGTICANKNISLASILQREIKEDNTAEITVITEKCQEKLIKEAVSELDNCTVNSLIRVAE
jgi:23S rRNA (adenine2503-C2)-methyltransferase